MTGYERTTRQTKGDGPQQQETTPVVYRSGEEQETEATVRTYYESQFLMQYLDSRARICHKQQTPHPELCCHLVVASIISIRYKLIYQVIMPNKVMFLQCLSVVTH